MSVLSTTDTLYAFRFLRLLTQDWKTTTAYKLGIVDDQGNILKKRADLTTSEEKAAYTLFHRLIWKLRKLLAKIPAGASTIARYAAALWLIKEQAKISNPLILEKAFLDHIGGLQLFESADAQFSILTDSDTLPVGCYQLINNGESFHIDAPLNAIGECLGYHIFEIKLKNGRRVVFTNEDIQTIF